VTSTGTPTSIALGMYMIRCFADWLYELASFRSGILEGNQHGYCVTTFKNMTSTDLLTYGSIIVVKSSNRFLTLTQGDSLTFQDIPIEKASRFFIVSAAGSFGTEIRTYDKINLRSKQNGRYVVCEYPDALCNRDAALQWETFTIECPTQHVATNATNVTFYCKDHDAYLSHDDGSAEFTHSKPEENEQFEIVTITKVVPVPIEQYEDVDIQFEQKLPQTKLIFITHTGLLSAEPNNDGFSTDKMAHFNLHVHPKNNRRVTISTSHGTFLHLDGDKFVQSRTDATRFLLVPMHEPAFELPYESTDTMTVENRPNPLDTLPGRFFLRIEQPNLHDKPLYLSVHPGGMLFTSTNRESWEQLLVVPDEFVVERQKYKTTGNLGAGAIGNVISAVNVTTGEMVAVKINSGDIERAVVEAQVTKTYGECPHLPKVYGIDIDSPYRVIVVMEYLHGENLTQFLKRSGPVNQQIALDIFLSVLRGLDHLHKRKILFLDISNNNVMIDNSGHVTIVDFGSTIFYENQSSFTKTRNTGGTCTFMPYEQFGSKFVVDRSTDIYSAALLFFWLLNGESPCNTAEKHFEGIEQRYLDQVSNDKLRNVLCKCLQVVPMDRYRTCDQVFNDLL
jgi:predicted Ser/Thr protein kinase